MCQPTVSLKQPVDTIFKDLGGTGPLAKSRPFMTALEQIIRLVYSRTILVNGNRGVRYGTVSALIDTPS